MYFQRRVHTQKISLGCKQDCKTIGPLHCFICLYNLLSIMQSYYVYFIFLSKAAATLVQLPKICPYQLEEQLDYYCRDLTLFVLSKAEHMCERPRSLHLISLLGPAKCSMGMCIKGKRALRGILWCCLGGTKMAEKSSHHKMYLLL